MRNLALIFQIIFILASFKINAKENEEDSSRGFLPGTVKAKYIHIFAAKCKEDAHKNEKLHFSEAKLALNYQLPFSFKGVVLMDLNYYFTHLKWVENPHFKKENYHRAGIALGINSIHINNWSLAAKVEAIFDFEKLGFNDYALYRGFLLSKYAKSEDTNIFIGITSTIGLKDTYIYPIIGFDYTGFEKWKIHVIFPTNVSLFYVINEEWSAFLRGRYFRANYRTPQKEDLPKGILYYKAFAAELGLKLSKNEHIDLSLFLGYNVGSELKVRNADGSNNSNYKFKGAPYAGVEATVNF